MACQRMKLNQNFKPYAKINSKYIEYFNIRSQIRKPEENIDVKGLQPESAAWVAEVREGFLEEGEAPWTSRI